MIRQLEKEDWPFILACLRECRDESAEYNWIDASADNADRIRQYYKAAMDAGVMFGVIEPDKGFMFGCVSRPWYDPRKLEAFEQLLYIREPHRGGLLAGKLIKLWTLAAEQLGANVAYAGATTGIAEDRTLKLYEKLGWSVSKRSVEIKLNVHSGT